MCIKGDVCWNCFIQKNSSSVQVPLPSFKSTMAHASDDFDDFDDYSPEQWDEIDKEMSALESFDDYSPEQWAEINKDLTALENDKTRGESDIDISEPESDFDDEDNLPLATLQAARRAQENPAATADDSDER